MGVKIIWSPENNKKLCFLDQAHDPIDTQHLSQDSLFDITLVYTRYLESLS